MARTAYIFFLIFVTVVQYLQVLSYIGVYSQIINFNSIQLMIIIDRLLVANHKANLTLAAPDQPSVRLHDYGVRLVLFQSQDFIHDLRFVNICAI